MLWSLLILLILSTISTEGLSIERVLNSQVANGAAPHTIREKRQAGLALGDILKDTRAGLPASLNQIQAQFQGELQSLFTRATPGKYKQLSAQQSARIRNPLTANVRQQVNGLLRSVSRRPSRFFSTGDTPFEINSQQNIVDELYEGDVVLDDDQMNYLLAPGRSKRQAYTMYQPRGIWPTTISYLLDASLSTTAISAITKAINYWQANTCLRFQNNPSNPNRFTFFAGAGCYSGVGMPLQGGVQGLSIGYGCEHVPVCAHEMGHALGFFHTQNRADRDAQIIVNYDNIPSQYYSNYVKLSTSENNNFNLPYDYGSGMHYDQYGFTINASIPTVVPNDIRFANSLGQSMPSFTDVQMINILYSCNAYCANTPNYCQNGGYPNPNNCATCLCPGGVGGTYCNTAVPVYNPYISPASEHITINTGAFAVSTSMSITGVPQSIDTDYKYKNMWILAPAGRRVQLTFSSTQGVPLCAVSCAYGGLEVKTANDKRLSGIRFCCPNDVGKVLTSDGSWMALTLFSRYGNFGATFTHQYGQI